MACSPTQDTVLAAVVTALGSGVGTVVNGGMVLEDDAEYLEVNGLLSTGSFNVLFVDLRGIEEFEGPGSGELMQRYHVEIRYWSLRTASADWSKEARVKAEAARDLLSGAASVFAINSQRQLYTPETVQIDSHGPDSIKSASGDQMVYVTVLSLQVEARRWS
jgi:hypothetical protein